LCILKKSGDLIHAVCSPIDPFNLLTHLHGFFLVYEILKILEKQHIYINLSEHYLKIKYYEGSTIYCYLIKNLN